MVWSSMAVATTLHNIENISPSWHISHRYGSSLEAQPNDILVGIVTTVTSNSLHNGGRGFMGSEVDFFHKKVSKSVIALKKK